MGVLLSEGSDNCLPESKVVDYVSLLKPRVMSLVVFTGLVGMLLAPGDIHPFIGFVAILSLALGSGAAGGLNMWYERHIDAVMERTKRRALPEGRVVSYSALEFCAFLAFLSVMIMAVAVNYVAAVLLLLAILFYVFVYTIYLKPRTPQNIVIGGAAGAFPPMIGWASVTGAVAWESILLFLIVFLWTPPHFWALALYKSGDYEKAGIPMLPNVSGNFVTRKFICIYAVVLSLVALLPFVIGMSGAIYFIATFLLNAVFLGCSVSLLLSYSERKARKTFFYSIIYLFLLFVFLLIDHYL